MKASNKMRYGRQVSKRRKRNPVEVTVTEQSRSPLVHHPPKNDQHVNPTPEKLALQALSMLSTVFQNQAVAPRGLRARMIAIVDRLSDREPVAVLIAVKQLGFAFVFAIVLCFAIIAAILFIYQAEVSTFYQRQVTLSNPAEVEVVEVNDHPHSVASREVVDKALVKD